MGKQEDLARGEVERLKKRKEDLTVRLSEARAAQKTLKDKCGNTKTADDCTVLLKDALLAVGDETRKHSIDHWKKEEQALQKDLKVVGSRAKACKDQLAKQIQQLDSLRLTLVQPLDGET